MSQSQASSSDDSLRRCLQDLPPAQRTDLFGLLIRLGGPQAGPGLQIGDYRLRREIGRGGMGIVFLAEQVALRGRHVAVKLLWAAGRETARKRFAREVLAAGRLDHPHIVPVLDADLDGPVPYYAMKFVDGRSLSVVLQDATWRADVAAVARVIRDLADALHHAHRHGIVHRDVKPANVMIDGDRRAQLLDFGLACLQEPDSVVTMTGDAIGTADYMAPEQIDGRWGPVGQWTDVYGLGVTLYECLTGQRPFTRPSRAATAAAILTGRAPPLRRVDAGLPRDLEAVCGKAMQLDPADRYASAGEFAADLDRFLARRPVLATAPGLLRRARNLVRRHRAGTAMVGIALAVAILAWVRVRLGPEWEVDARMPAIDAAFAARMAVEARIEALPPTVRSTRGRRELLANAATGDAELDRMISLALGVCPWHAEARRALADLVALQLRVALEGAGLKRRAARIQALEARLAASDTEGRHSALLKRQSGLAVRCARGPARVWLCPEVSLPDGNEGFVAAGSPTAIDLGRTPCATTVAEGHYALRATLPGYADLVLPWLLRRAAVQTGREAVIDLELLTGAEIGQGFRQVHAGFAIEADHERLDDERGDRLVWVDGFCMSEWEVTVADLQTLGVEVDQVLGPGAGALPGTLITGLTMERLLTIVTACNEVPARTPSRYRFSLPTPVEWRRAARGADGRSHAFGGRFDASKLRRHGTADHRIRDPERVLDRSPFGLFDMTGSLAEVCIDLQSFADGWARDLYRCGGDPRVLSAHDTALTMMQPFEDMSAWGPITALRLVRRRLPEPPEPAAADAVTLAPTSGWRTLAVHGPFCRELRDHLDFGEDGMRVRGFADNFSPRVLVWNGVDLAADPWSLEATLTWQCQGEERPVALVLGTTPDGPLDSARVVLRLGRREATLALGAAPRLLAALPAGCAGGPMRVRLTASSGRIAVSITDGAGVCTVIDGGRLGEPCGPIACVGFELPTLVGMELVVSELRITGR